MNINDIGLIVAERFHGWEKKPISEHATPMLCVGVGHDESSGKIVLLVIDDPLVGNPEIAAILRYVLRQVERGRV